jgi:hypothetical protein
MAVATRETIIANPARRRRKNVARKMSLKQKAAFGSKRVRAAAKAALSRQRKRKRTNAARKHHRPRTKPRSAPKKHRRRTNKAAAPKKRRKRATGSRKRANKKRRKNPGEIFALVNPAKGRKRMARTKRRKSSKKANAGSHRRRRNRTVKHHRRRSNPGIGPMKDWLSLGAGAVVGGVGATQLPQMLLAGSNTGAMGYFMNLAATGILAGAAHMFMKGNKTLTAGIIAGGVGATIRRIIGDYSLLGSYGTSLGMGDYLSNWNFATPQYTAGGYQSLVPPGGAVAAPMPVNVGGAGVAGLGYLGRPLY